MRNGFRTMAMKVFPSSPELKSGKYYMCGVDVCEEGVQFCNLDDRRCEYCADHYQDCFTYIQQQNCTQFCQDQWRKNLLDNCTVCEPVECEGVLVYKILSAVTSFLLLIAVFVIILQVKKRTRRALKRVVLFFIPDQIISAVQQLFTRNTTARRNNQEHNIRQNNIRPTPLERTSMIEDIENVSENNDSKGEESEQNEIQKLTKRKQSVNHDTAKSTSIGTNGFNDDLKEKRESETISTVITQSQPETFDSASSKKPAEKDVESGESLHDVVNGIQTAEKATKSNLDKNQAKAEFRKGDEVKISQTNEETELLKQYKTFPQIHDSEDIHVSDVIQSDQNSYIPPHGELSTMSSRGGYQAMLRSSNQSTDNGYVTTIHNKSTSNL